MWTFCWGHLYIEHTVGIQSVKNHASQSCLPNPFKTWIRFTHPHKYLQRSSFSCWRHPVSVFLIDVKSLSATVASHLWRIKAVMLSSASFGNAISGTESCGVFSAPTPPNLNLWLLLGFVFFILWFVSKEIKPGTFSFHMKSSPDFKQSHLRINIFEMNLKKQKENNRKLYQMFNTLKQQVHRTFSTQWFLVSGKTAIIKSCVWIKETNGQTKE